MKTRFPELLIQSFGRGVWRFVDASSGSPVGPHFRTKVEALCDLSRFATVFGCATEAEADHAHESETTADGNGAFCRLCSATLA